MRTKEIEADPSQYQDDESGKWESFVGAADKKIVAKAKAKDATGVKLRAGAALYAKAKSGDPAAKKAIVTMVAKAKKGDQQARRDVLAVKAGMMAAKAKQKAQKRHAVALAVRAKAAKVQSLQRRGEAAVANKLVRMERRAELHKLAKIERRSSAGNKSARAYVQQQVSLAQRGDKKAAAKVAKLKLVKSVRLAAPTKRERRNVASAGKLLARAQRGNPKAVRQIKVLQAAANKGNPNARRAVRRLQVAKAVGATIATGTAVAVVTKKSKKDKKKLTRAEAQKQVATAKAKAVTRSASREELAAGARAAQALGDKETAGKLAVLAAATPAATETLKKTAAVVAAKESGNPEATAAIDSSFQSAKSGNPDDIKKMGNVVAAQTIGDIQQGKAVSPAMRDAINLQERVAAKDPTAIAEVKRITEAATTESPIPEATAAAITLAAAAVTAKALAAKPQARKEFMEKVNPPLPPAEQAEATEHLNDYRKRALEGTITAEEGVVAERLAERLNQPKVAAEIAAYAPPPPPSTLMSSMPDMPQPPITGLGSLLKESLRALTFTTRDPLANWREGVASRAKTAPVRVSSRKAKVKSKVVAKITGCDDSMGWSPFDWFRKNLGVFLPGVAAATSAATLALNLKKSGGGQKPAPAPAPAPASPAPAATAPAAEVNKTAPSEAPVSSSGADKTLRDYVSQAIADKKISKRDFNRAVESQTGVSATDQTKKAVGLKVLEFFNKKGIKVET